MLKTRRDFLKSLGLVSGVVFSPWEMKSVFEQGQADPLFKISLAEWSLHRTLFAGEMDHLEFAPAARRQFGIEAVEYVNQFFMDKATDGAYLKEMKKRAENEGVRSLLIMVDDEGRLGSPHDGEREEAVENHYKWVEAARELACHSIRVNAYSDSDLDASEQQKYVAEGLRELSEYGEKHNINVLVENHGGLSSNAQWLVGVIDLVDHDYCGTMPDFGNFEITEEEKYDPYKGVRELMPYAKAVSAEALDFDENGNHVQVDYLKMAKIVTDADYNGHIGIEYEGDILSEPEGILAAKEHLEDVREQLSG